MNRQGLIKQYEIRRKKLASRLSNIKNYKSKSHLLKDAFRYLRLEKEIQIQRCYDAHEGE